MKKLISFVLIVVGTLSINGQSLSKYYVSRQVDKGLLFFVLEQKGFESGKSRMSFDQTMIDRSDTVRLGITLQVPFAGKIDSMFICRGEAINALFFDRHYLDPKGKNYLYRGFVHVPRSLMEELYADSLAPRFRFSGEGVESVEFVVKPKRWAKMRSINEAIYQLLRINSK